MKWSNFYYFSTTEILCPEKEFCTSFKENLEAETNKASTFSLNGQLEPIKASKSKILNIFRNLHFRKIFHPNGE